MKLYKPKPMNAIQQARAPRQVSDETFADLREQMVDEKLFFRNSTYSQTMMDSETGTKCKLWFDKKPGKWIAEFSDASGNVIQTLEADSRDELLLAVAASRAYTTAEQIEADKEPAFKSDWYRACYEWMSVGKWGKRFAEWIEYLPQETIHEIFEMIHRRILQMFPRASERDPRSIESAYVALLDAGRLDEFENAAKKNREWAEADAVKDAERARLAQDFQQRSEDGYERAMSEHEHAEDLKRLEADKKLSKTPKGMAELRRRALFGGKENAFPVSTGTAQRV